jgi:hypothetical protein
VAVYSLVYHRVRVVMAEAAARQATTPGRVSFADRTGSLSRASFADMLATLRCQSVRAAVLSTGNHGSGSRNIVKALLHAVKQAA